MNNFKYCEVNDLTQQRGSIGEEEVRHGKSGKSEKLVSDTSGTSGNIEAADSRRSGSLREPRWGFAATSGNFGNNFHPWEPPGKVTKEVGKVAKDMEKREESKKGVWEGRLRPYRRGQDLKDGKVKKILRRKQVSTGKRWEEEGGKHSSTS